MEFKMRIYLNIPYKDKDKAKKSGARWDKKEKSWYITYKDERDFEKINHFRSQIKDKEIVPPEAKKYLKKRFIFNKQKTQETKDLEEMKLRYREMDLEAKSHFRDL